MCLRLSMEIRKVYSRANDPNISNVSQVSDLRNKIKYARPVDDESRRKLAMIFSEEDEEEKDESQ